VVDREFMNKHVLVKNLRYTDGFLMGSRVSLGKNKWAAGTVSTGVEGATIFSVHKAPELMSSAPLRNAKGSNRAPRVTWWITDTLSLRVQSSSSCRIRHRREPWLGGGTLAVWGTLGLTFTACKSLGIHSIEDVSTVMKRRLTPYGEAIKERLTPLKLRFASGRLGRFPPFPRLQLCARHSSSVCVICVFSFLSATRECVSICLFVVILKNSK
jgi:hypothetical protein